MMNDIMYLDEALDYLNGFTVKDFITTYESYFMNLQEESKLFSEFGIVNEGVGDAVKKKFDKFKQWVINCIQKVKNFGKKIVIKVTNTLTKIFGNNFEKSIITDGIVFHKVNGHDTSMLLDITGKSLSLSNRVSALLNTGKITDINSDAETEISECENIYKEIKDTYDKAEKKEYEFAASSAKATVKFLKTTATAINKESDIVTKAYDKVLKEVERNYLKPMSGDNSAEKVDSERQNLIGIATKSINISISSLMLATKCCFEDLSLLAQATRKQTKDMKNKD